MQTQMIYPGISSASAQYSKINEIWDRSTDICKVQPVTLQIYNGSSKLLLYQTRWKVPQIKEGLNWFYDTQ